MNTPDKSLWSKVAPASVGAAVGSVATILTFLSTSAGTELTGKINMNLEETKHQHSLVSEILENKELEKQDAAAQILFLMEIGVIDTLDLDEGKIRQYANNP